MKRIIILSILLLIPFSAFAKDYHTRLPTMITANNTARVVRVINHATKGDKVYIDINSDGGESEGGNKVIRAIHASHAVIIANIQGWAASEAAFIAIECNKIQGYGELLFHIGYYDDNNDGIPDGGENSIPLSDPDLQREVIAPCKKILTPSEMRKMTIGRQNIVLTVQELKRRTGK